MYDLREYTIASYPSCFTDRFSSDMFVSSSSVRIKVLPDAVPVNRLTCRPVRKKLEIQASEQIKELLEAGIIKEATEPTPWCAASTFIEKSGGGVRLVTDIR